MSFCEELAERFESASETVRDQARKKAAAGDALEAAHGLGVASGLLVAACALRSVPAEHEPLRMVT